MKIMSPNHNYEAAYKKKSSGKLLWVSCKADTEKDAAALMDQHVATQYNNKGYNRYAGPLQLENELYDFLNA